MREVTLASASYAWRKVRLERVAGEYLGLVLRLAQATSLRPALLAVLLAKLCLGAVSYLPAVAAAVTLAAVE